ncbi:DNA processing protein DprA [Clostridium novyi B str. ATCC 27606]|uniref:DNA processing protein DprA n=1 Tax=Clostridium novyi B str. ATCC 27606 TaxID=1443123 RepID=A0AA40IV27_CLONO|nr:DNA-processing protein DprA [Clostridium novyi]KEI13630.1 DNA processing protein DprA [Clostridium novyi B str. NCTC 9691]KEI17586.1 DNA processing protein DprA [Clostridium novyi B str. ATCC 27606]
MNDYEIWFASAKLSYNIKNKLINKFKNVQNIWYYSTRDEKNSLINEKIKKALMNSWNEKNISNIKNKLIEEKIHTVTITDELYPKRLKVYEDSPYMLFYKGDITMLNNIKNVSIIGSRDCSSYGINVTNIICNNLCSNNINIVSGMAKGIDSIAHKKCLENHSYTCAVLGSGIDVIYPKENKYLYSEIIKNGCVISQFLPGTKPYSFNFPIRNRIISGLSDLVIVVEANKKSGTLITASAALEQGKDVIAVPGNIFSKQSKGTNNLIKDGAYTFTDIQDIYDLLKLNYVEKTSNNIKNMSIKETKVYKHINSVPIHFDEVLRLTNIDIKQLYEVLFELQLKDEIMYLSGNYYVRNNKTV